MTEEMTIRIREYDDGLAESLAKMYNGWDSLWPGGYTQGVPYDADRVKKQLGRMNALAILIAIDEETGSPVGSCTLHKHWRDRDAAYIGTLGVSPEALNKKVGKKLLLESVKRVSEAGYSRVDLNTWAGNMRAVPLYKKIGLMWNPGGEGLTMEGYVPGILDHPLCSPFFEKHTETSDDWYSLQVREVTQAPDDWEDRGMAVYNYRFESGDESLKVVVDRYARGICGVEEDREGSLSSSRLLLSTQNVVCGVEETAILEITNGNSESIEVEVKLSGPDGISFPDGSKTKMKVDAGQKADWSIPFVFGPESVLFREGIRAPSIQASITVGGSVYELVAGVRLKEAAEIHTRQGHCRLSAGGSCSIPLTLFSNLEFESEARIYFEAPQGVNVTCDQASIIMPPDGPAGAVLSVKANPSLKENAHDIWVWFEIEGHEGAPGVVTRKTRIPVFCLGTNGVAIGHDDKGKRMIVASPKYVAYCRREGGILTIDVPTSPDLLDQVYRTEIGPPYGLSPFRFAERDVETEISEHETTVSMNAQHPERPLWIEDRTVFEHGTGIVRREVWVKNTGPEKHTFQARLVGRQVGITFNPGQAYVPLRTGIVSEPMGVSRLSYPSLPNSPETFSEDWIATKGQNEVVGNFWNREDVDEIQVGGGLVGALVSKMTTLEPNEMRRIIGVTTVTGASSWLEVRRIWKARVNGVYEPALATPPTSHSVLDIETKTVLMPTVDEASVRLSLTNRIPVPLELQVEVEPPEDWMVADPIEPGFIVEGSRAIEVNVTPSRKVQRSFGIHRGRMRAWSEIDFHAPFDIVCLGTDSEGVDVEREELEGKSVYRVRNGLIEFVASSEYGGCMTSLKNANGVELLLSSFPNPGPRPGAFFDNYYGGIQPIIFDEEMSESLTKAKTNEEPMESRKIKDGVWTGVEMSWTGTVQRITQGVEFSLRYLTAPGSPVILVNWTMRNKTSAPLRFFPILSFDPGVNENPADLVLQSEWSGIDRTVRPGAAFNSLTPSNNFIYFRPAEDSDSTRGLALVAPNGDTGLLGAHAGPIIFTGAIDLHVLLMPGEERTMRCAVLVDPEDVNQVKDFQRAMERI